MTEQEYIEIMDKSNFMIDSANPYDMEIKKALEKQIPKEPIQQDEDCLECPNCGQAIKWE